MLAANPMVVKKPIINGSRSVMSNSKSVTPYCRAIRVKRAMTRPPTTGAGMLNFSSGRTRRRRP